MKAICRRCAHLCVPLDAAGRRRTRKGYAYLCEAPVPEITVTGPIPKSLSHAPRWPYGKVRMEPEQGVDCPAFVAYLPASLAGGAG